MGWVADHLGFDYNFVVSGALNLLAIGLMGAALPSRTRGERRILQQRQLHLQQSHLAARRADGLAAAADSAREPLQRLGDSSPSSRQLPAAPTDATPAAATTEAETAEAEAEVEAGEAEAEAEEAASLASAALRPRFVFFLCEMMAIGLAFTVVEKFIFVFIIKELGGSQSLCGYSVAVNVIFEVPIFHFGDALLRTLGHEAMVLLSLLAYALRVFGYSCLQTHTVWALLALEPLHGITYALSWTAAVDKVKAEVPAARQTSGMLLLNSAMWCAGRTAGSLLGGSFLQHGRAFGHSGGRALYLVAACASAGLIAAHVVITLLLRAAGQQPLLASPPTAAAAAGLEPLVAGGVQGGGRGGRLRGRGHEIVIESDTTQ
mmetsp:Transcript_17956/g.57237  ORF Transcript_17956/g.57237 Transcript_17956/m.57237 type:complete len:376 (+) Transcript_17956:609-1736(+)